MRRELLRGAAASVAGGLPPMRPDQVTPSTSPGVAPGTASGTFRGRLVVVFGTGPNVGVFVYSGAAPGAGNLVASITAGAGTDPYGNHYDAGITSYDTAFGGVTELNGAQFSLFSGANLKILFNANGAFFYSPAAGAGNLVASITPAAGSDAFGNTYQAGITEYVTVGGARWAVNLGASVTVVGTLGNFAALSLQNLSSPMTQPASVAAGGNGVAGGQLILSSPQSTAGASASGISLQDSVLSGLGNGLINVLASELAMPIGDVRISNQTAPASSAGTAALFGSGGHLDVVAGDTNTYDTERLTLRTSGGTVSSTVFATIGGLTKHVGAGTYSFRAHLMYVGNGVGTVGNALFKVVSPAFTDGGLNLVGTANGPLVSVRFDNASGFGSSLVAPALAAGDSTTRYDVVIEGSAVFTAAGTLAVQTAISGAGTAQFVIARGSTFTIEPVVAA